MGSMLDLYDDLFAEPVTTNARAGSRFQPRAKPRPKKKSSLSVPSAVTNDTKQKPVIVAPTDSKTAESVQPVDVSVADDRLTEPVGSTTLSSNLIDNEVPLKNIEDSSPQLPPSDDLKTSECENPTSQLVGTGEDVGATNVPPLEVAISDSSVNWGSSSGKSAGEADSLGDDIDHFDDILLGRAISNVRACGKFQPKAKPRPRKVVTARVPSVPSNAAGQEHVKLPSISSDTMQSVPTLDVIDNELTDPVGSFLSTSEIVGTVSPLEDNEGSFPDNNQTSGLAESLSQLCSMRQEEVSTDDLHLEVAISEGTGNWESNLGASAGKADSMGFVLDPFSDILPEPTPSNFGAGRKFQPKVKPRSRKETSASGTSALHNVVKENLIKEPLENYEGPLSGVPFSDDTRSLASVSPSSKIVITDAEHLEVENCDVTGHWHSISRKLTGENADIFSGLEYLDDFLSQSTTSTLTAATKSQHKVTENSLPGDTFLTTHHFDTNEGGPLGPSETSALHASNTEGELNVVILSSVDSSAFRACDGTQAHSIPEFLVTQDLVTCTEAAVSNNDRDFLINNGRLETEFQQAGSFGIEYMGQGSVPSFPSDDVPDFAANIDPTGPAESLPSDAAISGDVVYSESASGVPGKVIYNNRKRKTPMASDLSQKPQAPLAAGEGIEAGGTSRRLRKRLPDSNLNEPEDGNYDSGFPAESPSNFDDDNNDGEYRANNASPKKRKRVPRKFKEAGPENEKPVQKRKKANEVPDKSTKEPPKKFSHSTRRNKRRVDKVLLETPECEIDRQKVPLKQLILLAEIRERIANKEASNSGIPSTNQSADNSSSREASYNEEEAFASELDRDFNDDQTGSPVKLNNGVFNYHSFMDRTPSTRWSKKETELFYEAVQQFGTDFSMIQQLFQGRTRNQIKLKFKKEERQHPLRLSEAVQNRAKNHSHFELVIEKLHQAAQTQAEEESNRDENGVSGEEDEVEDVALETNEEAAKSEQKQQHEDEDNKVEANGAESRSLEDSDDGDDLMEQWNQYRSSFR